MSAYRSIFLEPDWAHTRYYGWRDNGVKEGIRTLSKQSGPLSRSLMLSETTDTASIVDVLRQERRRLGPISEIVIHDFSNALQSDNVSDNLGFKRLSRDRLLNTKTFVIDLGKEDDELLAAMSPDTRRRIRKGERDGLVVDIQSGSNGSALNNFLIAHASLEKEHGLKPLDRNSIAPMLSDGAAMLLSSGTSENSCIYLLTYRAGDKAIWLHGVGRGGSADAGQLIQWRAMQTLRSQGIRWYDLGGVPTADKSNSIFRFKEGFGGDLINLGREYRFRSVLARVARLGLSGANKLR